MPAWPLHCLWTLVAQHPSVEVHTDQIIFVIRASRTVRNTVWFAYNDNDVAVVSSVTDGALHTASGLRPNHGKL